jgi:hypothetical protein
VSTHCCIVAIRRQSDAFTLGVEVAHAVAPRFLDVERDPHPDVHSRLKAQINR